MAPVKVKLGVRPTGRLRRASSGVKFRYRLDPAHRVQFARAIKLLNLLRDATAYRVRARKVNDGARPEADIARWRLSGMLAESRMDVAGERLQF